jgi:hypothetical protein
VLLVVVLHEKGEREIFGLKREKREREREVDCRSSCMKRGLS